MESSYRRHSLVSGFSFILLLLLAGLLAPPASAQEPDQVGIYFDEAYTDNQIFTGTAPALVPAHLVLFMPTAPGGVGGWECRLKIDGPAQLASTEYAGEAINVETPPFFMVGVGDPPLPGIDQIRLATFQILVNEEAPVVLSLLPLYLASIPGEMAYLAGDGSGEILPMTPVGGDEMVAFINVDSTPVCELTPSILGFQETPVGERDLRSFTIENPGIVPLGLTLDLPDDCTSFRLVSPPEGSASVQPMSSLEVTVAFEPDYVGYHECQLSLGSTCPDITLYGTGREPVLSWQAPTEVDFGEIVLGTSLSRIVTVRNTGEVEFVVEPSIDSPWPYFTVSSTQPRTVYPGSQYSFYVYYSPSQAGTHTGTLDLGGIVAPIALTGSTRDAVTSWEAPELLDFGEVDWGQSATLPLTILNTGDTTIYVSYTLGEGCSGFFLSDDSPAYITGGSSHTIDVSFSPTSLGTSTCQLDLGGTIPPVTLTGLSLNEVPDWEISPDQLVFPVVLVDESFALNAVFENVGNTPLDLDAELVPATPEFSIEAGGDPGTVLPGESAVVTVRFSPTVVGEYSTQLDFGGDLGVIPVSGVCEEPYYECVVFPTDIAFGSVRVGQSETAYFGVTNHGNQILVIDPTDDSPHFTVQPGQVAIQPGETVNVAVEFHPFVEDALETFIDLGHFACTTVHCAGLGYIPTSSDGDLVGFTFDENTLAYDGFEYESWEGAGTVVQAHLGLIRPSVAAPLAGWELCARLEGPGMFVSWDLYGEAINVLEEPCFMVGLGEPLPMASYYLMATANIFVASVESPIVLSLEPVYHASIPGEMAWLAGNDPGEIVPMRTYSGIPEVAFIHPYTIVAVTAPTPAVAADGGEGVELSWSLPEGGFDSCNVYRRVPGQTALVVHSMALAGGVRDLAYRDDTAGLPPGSTLFYSYALLEGGVEKARSPEVEVTLPAALPSVTRLLPNVPNPFNPQTEIRFELKQAGPVRVTIYDVTGRRVRTLVDESCAAGPNSRTWDGRDDRGRQAPSGAYYVRLETPDRLDRRKVMLLK